MYNTLMDENKKPENLQESDEIVVITDNVNTNSSGSPVAEPISDENASWSYNSGANQGFDESPQDTQYSINPISWTASEYIAHDKSPFWYVSVSLMVFAFAGLILILDGVDSWLSPLLIILAGVIFMVAASRKPQILEYMVDDSGIHVGKKLFHYSQFKSFSLVPEGPIMTIVLTPLQRFMPSLTIYYETKDQESIVEVLSSYLPHETKKLDLIDNLMRKIRF